MKKLKTAPYAIAGLLALASILACNSSTDSSAGGSGLTAKFRGKAWTATAIGTYANALGSSPGTYIFGGTDTVGGSRSIIVTLYNIPGPGTYKLGTGTGVRGGVGQAGESNGTPSANSWITDGTGVDGEITITEIGKGRIKATFRFTAVPGARSPLKENLDITEGKVDLEYKGTPVAMLDKYGGNVTATLNGKPYNAASIHSASLKDINGNAGINIVTTTSVNGISLMVAGATAPGKYPIIHKQPNPVSIGAGKNGTDPETCCWGSSDLDSAVIEITSLTATRIKGKFSGKLGPNTGKPATAPLSVVDGEFDVGVTDP